MSASLSTVSSGVNSIATVLLEDIYKRIATGDSKSDQQHATMSKILCNYALDSFLLSILYRMISFLAVLIGLLVVFLAFIASYLGDNIIVVTTESFVLLAHEYRSNRSS